MVRILLSFLFIYSVLYAVAESRNGLSERDIPVDTMDRMDISGMDTVSETVFVVPLTDGLGKIHLYKQRNQSILLEFDASHYRNLRASLTVIDENANVRFALLVLPDGTTDGPFGREIDYRLPQQGVYRLVLHENMMAGDPWEGEITVEILLSNTRVVPE